MKRLLNIALMAATVCCLSLAVTSCKDDDNSNNGGNNSGQADGATDAADRFWAVAANLVSPFDVTDDYADKTFEPTIGEPTDGNTTVRVVVTADEETAAANFSAIVDANLTAGATTYTYHDDAVGTLTYNKSADGKSLATVDVSIKQIPGLQRIVYKTPDQMGENAVHDGVPYYSFGDIVSRTRTDGVKEYWICIHPAFTKQGLTEVIWASVSQLPEKNVWTYKGSNNITYKLPTGLGNNKEYMKNLTELLLAMESPDKWEKNLTDGPTDMKAFGDIKKENLQYINKHFWTLVGRDWSNKHYADSIFGANRASLVEKLNSDGLKFIYHGKNWKTSVSNKPTLWESVIKNGAENSQEANARSLEWHDVTKEVIKKQITIDCIGQLQNVSQWVNKDFFGSQEPRYIFRFAKSKELAGKKKTIYESIADGNNIKDVYLYNEAHHITVGANQKMAVTKEGDFIGPVTADEAKVGNFITPDGRFWTKKADADNHGGAVAVVAYVGGNKRVEMDSLYNGLAIALNPIKEKMWAKAIEEDCEKVANYDNMDDPINDFKGMANTRILSEQCYEKHGHEAAKACYDYAKVNERYSTISRWFLPSVGQWQIAIDGMKQYSNTTGNFLKIFALDEVITEEAKFWTSTPQKPEFAYYFMIDKGWVSATDMKLVEYDCLPFLAFRYGEGGIKDPSYY